MIYVKPQSKGTDLHTIVSKEFSQQTKGIQRQFSVSMQEEKNIAGGSSSSGIELISPSGLRSAYDGPFFLCDLKGPIPAPPISDNYLDIRINGSHRSYTFKY